jgi:crotonobetainyl-CoA:carnitine CoA-transferase CaiB-like acyl-CoA transferase
MVGPLEGVKVVELGVWVAGPAAGCILADWGAEVVKVEPKGGDPSRQFFFGMSGAELPLNPIFENDNRSKRSIALDLSAEEGRAVVLELVDGADVFLTNVRLAGLARRGLDPESLLDRNPRLVYAAITGYGLEGEDADRAAYDVGAYWARSGLAALLSQPDGPPPFQRGGMGDHGAAMSAAAAVSAALFRREKTGQGQLVSTSLLRQGLYTLSFDLAIAVRLGVSLAPSDRKTMTNPAMNSYCDSHGQWFWIVGLEGPRHWPALARAVGHPEWIDDPRFAEARERAANAAELIAMLDEIFATRPREEWGQIFDTEKELWWAPVQTLDEALADPQVHAAGGFVEVPDGVGTTLLPASPVDFGESPCQPRSMAPELGQHSDEILAELGRSAAEIAELRERGVVG